MEAPPRSPYDTDMSTRRAQRGAQKGWYQMNGRNGLPIRVVAAAALALAIAMGIVASASAQEEELISIGSASLSVGAEGSVSVNALNIPDPGLGAWTIDITYDPVVVSVVACVGEHGGVCNPAFESNILRITGATASGIIGDNSLGSAVFRCNAVGTSSLTVNVPLLVDGTIGDPQPVVAATQNGVISCTTPSTNGGDDDDVFDCSDFLFRDIGQAILDADPSDPHNLDPDNDGVACEDLPPRGDPGTFPSTGVGVGGEATAGQIARWLMAAFAGLGLAMAGGIALLRYRAARVGVHRR